MEFMYNYARLPEDRKLLIDINTAAGRLFNKLSCLDIDSLDISDYSKKYLGNHLRNIHSTLQKYSYVLSWSIASANCPLNEFVFIEYGGGSGILSLLAKELKINTVIYNDIYEISCKDAKIIGESIGNQADYYVHGDIDDVISFLKTNSISCNAIASYDVIEHIYDIETFLKKLNNLSDGPMSVVMSSGANMFNPLIKKSIMTVQREMEYRGANKEWGHKERDCLRAYSRVREEMILKYAPYLTKKEVEQLAKATRCMIESDIQDCIDEYLKTGVFPQEPCHPTNTCDPYTGNWCEHLMDIDYLKDILSKEGFKVEILSGYYGRPENLIKRILATFLNVSIYISKKKGIRIAPFYTVYGIKI